MKPKHKKARFKNLAFLGFGGAKRDRTADLLHAMQALSQLSYSPKSVGMARHYRAHFRVVNPFKAFLIFSKLDFQRTQQLFRYVQGSRPGLKGPG